MSSIENSPIAFTGGGTGGHVYPAKPVIDLVLQRNPLQNIYWIGSEKGMESQIIREWGMTYYGIPSGKFRRYLSFRNFTDLFLILAGFFKARSILKKKRPLYLFSKGGFVSVPPVMAAWTLGIPVFTHESDVTPGLATRINSPFVTKIFLPYEKSLTFYSGQCRKKCIVSGNPVRKEFFTGSAQGGRDFVGSQKNLPLLLVLGGSLGAQQINALVEENLDSLTKFCFVVHQTGRVNYTPLEHENYFRAPYFHHELYDIMAAADGALTRSGAGILWELTASGTALLMLPLMTGSRGDQPLNARVFAEAGVGRILDENTGPDLFVEAVRSLLEDKPSRDQFDKAAAFLNLGKAETIILAAISQGVAK